MDLAFDDAGNGSSDEATGWFSLLIHRALSGGDENTRERGTGGSVSAGVLLVVLILMGMTFCCCFMM